MRGALIIFVKAPVAGRVKTRLARAIGAASAAAKFRLMARLAIAAAEKGRWKTFLAIEPASALSGFSTIFPARIPRFSQARGDLGRRMRAAIAAAPSGPVVIIGADAPALRARHLRAAFQILGRDDAVFGPAKDGGYYLVGLARRRAAPGAFRNVDWSTEKALAQSIESLPPGFSVGLLETLADVDEAADLEAIGARAFLRSYAQP